MTLEYDEAKRIEALRKLSPRLRVAFALLCAERALPGYRRFHALTGRGDPCTAESLAERLWFDIAGDQLTPAELDVASGRVEDLLEDFEECERWHDVCANGDDATAALAYAFRARIYGDPQDAAWAGRRLFDLAHYYAERDIVPDESRPIAEQLRLLLANPLVQGELARQERDLRELGELAEEFPDFLERMKARSASEAAAFLPV